MSAPNASSSVGGLRPRRNSFNLTYSKLFDCDLGQLVPVMCDEVVPGDYFKIGAELVIRFQPLAAPVMHTVTASLHYFFVPYRLLFDGVKTGDPADSTWENFIKQGFYDEPTLPIKLPTVDLTSNTLPNRNIGHPSNRQIGTLWDYFGFPVIYNGYDGTVVNQAQMVVAHAPSILKFPWRAYNFVYNEYYRDDELQPEVAWDNPLLLRRNWRKDYFTVSRTRRQAGQAAGMPVSFYTLTTDGVGGSLFTPDWLNLAVNGAGPDTSVRKQGFSFTGGNVPNNTSITVSNTTGSAITGSVSAKLGVDLSGASILSDDGSTNKTGLASFDVADLRLAFQLTKWLERNERAGKRYTEFLKAHFGVSPSDARLDRPEYIGGAKMPVVFSEVLQTSQTNSSGPDDKSQLGTMGGHGLAATGDFIGKYNVQEYGLIIGLLSVMPQPVYQNGVNRQWTRTLPIDFYFPEFSLLSEQAVFAYEIWASLGLNFTLNGVARNYDDNNIFGFIPQYDEMRTKYDMVCGNMRRPPAQVRVTSNNPNPLPERPLNLSYWHLAREFSTPPLLNTEFITCTPRKDIYLAPRELGLIVHCTNKIHAARPLPSDGIPGLVDHN